MVPSASRSGSCRRGGSAGEAAAEPVACRAVTGVGLDLLEIDRLARALERRPRLAERLFTSGERAFAAQRGEPARHLAVRFCAKEAVAKALALRDGDWHDVEVLGGGDGPPAVRLSGRARTRADELGVEVEVSLTHSKGMAGAVAILLVPAGEAG
jgi:holo-[acyl-carrier protein] synthase